MFLLMEISTKDSSKMEIVKGQELILGLMKATTAENGLLIK